uniref:Uncharacterized protein n=1 Tax=Fundulus heteroclitus TaxID=8078 RepID=A0A3Q2PJ02_FUNHE
MESSLIRDNPLLLPLNKEKTVYDGFITVQVGVPAMYRCNINLHQGSPTWCPWTSGSPPGPHVERSSLFKEIAQPSSELHLKCYFIQLLFLLYHTCIYIHLKWTKALKTCLYYHPAEAPDCSADLPVPLTVTWTPQSTLEQLHSQFLLVLESLTDFWDVLDEIDKKTWVLEPERPSRLDTMRRIAIGNNVSIKVEVDPRHPKMLPECCLLGADHGGVLKHKAFTYCDSVLRELLRGAQILRPQARIVQSKCLNCTRYIYVLQPSRQGKFICSTFPYKDNAKCFT